jgi:hypothetical protein
MAITWKDLKEPFADDGVEWRVQRCGKKNGKVWAQLVPYVTARAIMDRLDKVVGPDGWQTEIHPIGDGFLCRMGIKTTKEWVWRTDGAPVTDIEPLKGGISGAIKRVAVQFGMGRYLYGVPVVWAENIQEGYQPSGQNTVSIFSKKDDIRAWCPTPSIGKKQDTAPPPKASSPEKPANGNRTLIQELADIENEAHANLPEKINSRKKHLGVDDLSKVDLTKADHRKRYKEYRERCEKKKEAAA